MFRSLLQWLAGLSESRVVEAYQKLTTSLQLQITKLEERLDKCEATHLKDQGEIKALTRQNRKQESEIDHLNRSLSAMQERLTDLENKLQRLTNHE